MEVKGYPHCCGAIIVCEFPYEYDESVDTELSKIFKTSVDAARKGDVKPSPHSRFDVVHAILNDEQEAELGETMLNFGFQMVSKVKNPRHESCLYSYVWSRTYLKGVPQLSGNW